MCIIMYTLHINYVCFHKILHVLYAYSSHVLQMHVTLIWLEHKWHMVILLGYIYSDEYQDYDLLGWHYVVLWL